jgi:hypothetical protein
MRLAFFLLIFFAASFGARAENTRPVIMQSVCTPKQPDAGFDPFGFELIQTGTDWAARVYPVSGAKRPVPMMEFPKAPVAFVNAPTPGNVVIVLSQTVEQQGIQHSVIALSEIPAGQQPKPFSVTLTTGAPGPDATHKRHRVESTCKFVNEDAPYDRKPL